MDRKIVKVGTSEGRKGRKGRGRERKEEECGKEDEGRR